MRMHKIALASLALSGALVARTQDAITLRLQFKEGDQAVYKMASTVDQAIDASGMGGGVMNMKIESSSKVTQKFGKVDAAKGVANVEFIFTDNDVKMEGGVGMPMPDMPKEYKLIGKIDNRNRLLETKMEGLPAEMMMMGGNSAQQTLGGFHFPEGPVKVGDKWDIIIPKMPSIFKEDQKLVAVLKKERDLNGKPVLDVSVRGTMNMNLDLAEIAKQSGQEGAMGGMKMTISGTIEVDTLVTVDKASGMLIQMDQTAKNNMSVNLEDMGATIPVTGTTVTILKKV